jgi:hypothetical protein
MKYWAGRPWSSGLLTKGLKYLKAVAKKFVFTPTSNPPVQDLTSVETENAEETPELATPLSANFMTFFAKESSQFHEAEIEISNFDREIGEEIDYFKRVISSKEFIRNCKSTRDFWLTNSHRFPYLFFLSLILSSILASSAFIERYFSICGIHSNKFTNMSDSLFEMRSMLKTNIDTLNKMSDV